MSLNQEMKRLFVAIKIYPDSSFKTFIQELHSSLGKEKIRWVNSHNLHLTLRFLGETGIDLIPQISEELIKAALQTNSFSITLKGLGVFRSVSYPRVLWIGIDKNEDLQKLKKKVDNSLQNVGFAAESHNYIPHLTVGRMKKINDRDNLRNLIQKYGEYEFQMQDAESMVLYESKLRESGPEYMPVKECFFL